MRVVVLGICLSLGACGGINVAADPVVGAADAAQGVADSGDNTTGDASGAADSEEAAQPDTTGAACPDWKGGLWQSTTLTVTDECLEGKLRSGVFLRSGLETFGWIAPLEIPTTLPSDSLELAFHESSPQNHTFACA